MLPIYAHILVSRCCCGEKKSVSSAVGGYFGDSLGGREHISES